MTGRQPLDGDDHVGGLDVAHRIEQDRCTSPLMWTEQAPHWATPQPYLVPVRPTCSRMTHSSGVSASTATSVIVPLILSFAMGFLPRLDARAFNQLCHPWQVEGEQSRVRLGRHLVVAERQGSELLELLHELRLGQGLA